MTENNRATNVIEVLRKGLQADLSHDKLKELLDAASMFLMVGSERHSCLGCGSLFSSENPITWHASWVLGNCGSGVRGRLDIYHCGDCDPYTVRRKFISDDVFGFPGGNHEMYEAVHGSEGRTK